MNFNRLLIVIFLMALLSACVSTHSYKNDVRRSSYILLGSNVAKVSYYEDRPTKRVDLITDLVYSCAVATTDYGYDYFIILGGDLGATTPNTKVLYQRTFYNRPPQCNAKYYDRVTELRYDQPWEEIQEGQMNASVVIQMFKKPRPPKLWYAYDAREMMFYKKPPG